MGRIKSMLVKRTSKQLLRENVPLGETFEQNKKVLGKNSMPSKKMRNKIAGYIARLVKMQRVKAAQTPKRPLIEETQFS